MKTVFAALALSILAVVPASAGTNPEVRGSARSAEVPAENKVEAAPPRADAAPAKKVRIVLASPYGN